MLISRKTVAGMILIILGIFFIAFLIDNMLAKKKLEEKAKLETKLEESAALPEILELENIDKPKIAANINEDLKVEPQVDFGSASDAEKNRYVFMSDATGKLPDGTDGSVIV